MEETFMEKIKRRLSGARHPVPADTSAGWGVGVITEWDSDGKGVDWIEVRVCDGDGETVVQIDADGARAMIAMLQVAVDAVTPCVEQK